MFTLWALLFTVKCKHHKSNATDGNIYWSCGKQLSVITKNLYIVYPSLLNPFYESENTNSMLYLASLKGQNIVRKHSEAFFKLMLVPSVVSTPDRTRTFSLWVALICASGIDLYAGVGRTLWGTFSATCGGTWLCQKCQSCLKSRWQLVNAARFLSTSSIQNKSCYKTQIPWGNTLHDKKYNHCSHTSSIFFKPFCQCMHLQVL